MPHHQQLKTPQDFFLHELADMLGAEHTIEKMLGEAQGLVQDPQIKQDLQMHQQQTRGHIQNLERVFQQLGTQPQQVECKGMKGIQAELKEIQKEQPSPEVLQSAVVGGAAKTEHYEIASYTGLVKKARAMGQTQVADLLQQNLRQEQEMLQIVEGVEDRLIQQMAAQMGAAMGQAQAQTAPPM
jgi:ferritin-like metal-binding protein YciE